jgi:hypothetical protein
MKALALSREYFRTIAEPRLKTGFPELYTRLSAGLVGNGSECFGYDDELSRDHDWGVDFFLWLPEGDREAVPALRDWKNKLFESNPPEFTRERSAYGARIGVMTVGDFYKSLVGYPEGPDTLPEWRRVPEENFAMAVNGEVFLDNGGAFTAVREKLLRHFPEDIRRRKLAARCMALAQTGQYNFARCYKRRDWVTLRTVLCRFADAVISAVFLLNRVYMPYYKWAFRKMKELPILGEAFAPPLLELAHGAVSDDAAFGSASRLIETLCAGIAAELRRQGLSSTDDWFLTTQAEELRAGIKDDFLRALPAQYE